MNPRACCRAILFVSICFFTTTKLFAGQVSCTIQKAPTDPAARAFAAQDYAKALALYAAAAKNDPKNLEAISGQVRSLLELQQVGAAAEIAEKNFAAHSTSAELATALGEVRFRQGRLGDAFNAYRTSTTLNPCLAHNGYELYRLYTVESMYESAYSQLQTAYQLEPDDPEIHFSWIERLPLAARAREIDKYLANPSGTQDVGMEYLARSSHRLHAILTAGNGTCHLLPGSATTTTLPLAYLLVDAYRFRAMGFDITVNNKAKARLELDTGASGILLNRATAAKAGLVPVIDSTITGIGDEKSMTGFWAFADDLRIGSLEFKHCMVEVSDKKSVIDTDGLIGPDVFENYQVQLRFPFREMTLSPLPLRPGEIAAEHASLNASGIGTENASTETVHYRDRYVSPEMKNWTGFARIGHQILIYGELKDLKPRLFLLDSGASRSVLSIPAAKAVGKIHIDHDDHMSGLNGKVDKLYRADSVDLLFAGLRDPLKDVLVMNTDSLSASDGTEISGLIGLDTLRYLTLNIDYRDGLIQILYNPK